MSTILDIIAGHARERVALDRERISLAEMKALAATARAAGQDFLDVAAVTGKAFVAEESDGQELSETLAGLGQAFYDAVAKPGLSFICEVKKASPSKGVIDPVFDYMGIAREYEAAGADCISCLTEPRWFMGSDEIFRNIRTAVRTPMLRKDFVVDEYQIYQAAALGANCVLLICAILDTKDIAGYLGICEDLGLAALVEAHDEAEIASAVSAGARMIGVNNRNLKDFSVDFANAARLRARIPADRLYVAESGVMSPQDAAAMKAVGADAILMGEVLMRAEDKKSLLKAMREAAR
ncbi:MAG: indole-3-glycerol phosphate synthase TrpC [Lachnospiraceae bacterium]|nr:indole-3-glycerol phosphate synthase TrpC [Lachnospiraceae bacterium]